MINIKINKFFVFILSLVIIGFWFFAFNISKGLEVGEDDDVILYDKYEQFLRYSKRNKYKEYKKIREKYKKYKRKYAFSSSSERRQCKKKYRLYKKYRKNPILVARYIGLKSCYKKYKKYKDKYKPIKERYHKLKKYKKYKKYDKNKYRKNKLSKYGKEKYKRGWLRYKRKNKKTQADLGGGYLGPEITIGLFSFSKDDLKKGSVRLKADNDYLIKDISGKVLTTISGGEVIKIRYLQGGRLRITGSVTSEILVDREVVFEAKNVNDSNLIFEILSPEIKCYSRNCNQYRGKIKLRYSPYSKKIWLINQLPLEQYVWGMGEITGEGDDDYDRVMAVVYRTYGYWKIKYSTKYASEGFKVNATPGNQLYFGYVWEKNHLDIKKAAKNTRGKIVMYDDRIAIVPYSSWTDGRTRSWKERWGSENYPWCQSVKDDYGKHPSKSYKQLQAEGNHMVGLSAHGALKLANKKKWDYKKILKYYLKKISIYQAY